MKLLAAVLSALGAVAATMGTQGCYHWIMDEPEMPASLLEK